MPNPTPAAYATGRLSIRAITAATSGAINTSGPPATPICGPSTGADSSAPTPDSPAAKVHANRDNLRTGMPRSSARSGDSAAARTATPTSLRVRNSASAIRITGTASSTRTWSLPKKIGPSRKCTGSEVWNVFSGRNCV